MYDGFILSLLLLVLGVTSWGVPIELAQNAELLDPESTTVNLMPLAQYLCT